MEKNKFEVIKKYSIKVDKKILDECKGKKGEKEVLRNRVLKRKLEKIFKENMVDMIGGREIEVKKIFKCDEDRVIWCELIEEIKKGDMREYKVEEILIIMELV
jgi:hypothetical protein